MYKIYTDGSCKKSGDEGGWAFIIIDENSDVVHKDSGYSEKTTSQNEEIRAVKEALIWCKDNIEIRSQIKLYSDSKYAVNGCNSWMFNWATKDWKNSKKETVAHVEYWKEIYANVNRHEYKFKHIKAHNGHYWNEKADSLARGTWQKEKSL